MKVVLCLLCAFIGITLVKEPVKGFISTSYAAFVMSTFPKKVKYYYSIIKSIFSIVLQIKSKIGTKPLIQSQSYLHNKINTDLPNRDIVRTTTETVQRTTPSSATPKMTQLKELIRRIADLKKEVKERMEMEQIILSRIIFGK